MPINIKIEDIILQIFKEALKKGYKKIGRTRLVKLLYLVEYEYYKLTNERLTTLRWVFHHYGPYAFELTGLMNGKLTLIEEEEHELDTGRIAKLIGFRDSEEFEEANFIYDLRTESIIREVVDTWCDADINELLNYVYHYTEPMQEAKKGELLNFSNIKASNFTFPKLSQERIKELRKKFKELSYTQLSQRSELKGKPLYPLPELSFEWKGKINKALLVGLTNKM